MPPRICDTLSLAEEKDEMMIAIGANCLAPPIVPLIFVVMLLGPKPYVGTAFMHVLLLVELLPIVGVENALPKPTKC